MDSRIHISLAYCLWHQAQSPGQHADWRPDQAMGSGALVFLVPSKWSCQKPHVSHPRSPQ